jgi:hypothetical protein
MQTTCHESGLVQPGRALRYTGFGTDPSQEVLPMHRPLLPIMPVVGVAVLSACASEPQFPEAAPEAVAECRREAALLTEPDPWTVRNDPIGRETETGDVIDDARAAESEAGRQGLAGWPEEVLIYRCLASRGEPLTTEQAGELADWQERLEEPESR